MTFLPFMIAGIHPLCTSVGSTMPRPSNTAHRCSPTPRASNESARPWSTSLSVSSATETTRSPAFAPSSPPRCLYAGSTLRSPAGRAFFRRFAEKSSISSGCILESSPENEHTSGRPTGSKQPTRDKNLLTMYTCREVQENSGKMRPTQVGQAVGQAPPSGPVSIHSFTLEISARSTSMLFRLHVKLDTSSFSSFGPSVFFEKSKKYGTLGTPSPSATAAIPSSAVFTLANSTSGFCSARDLTLRSIERHDRQPGEPNMTKVAPYDDSTSDLRCSFDATAS
mmetsp:Transcript_12486/g.35587  ORF Transcript_12486/g.35587 Transcript_12486/m.35587 type:complete len:281 (-) Transcript_12486:601-1443(-)